jgi:peptidoglycan/LPS O-acetylase OafA/YrhL
MNRKGIAGDRRRRKLIAALWALGLAAVVIVLIYLEQTAVLYILCTLGISALLVIVAFANLGQHEETASQPVVQPPGATKET